MQINFGGIDPSQMQLLQQTYQMCAQHPECEGCPMTPQGVNGITCSHQFDGGNSQNNNQNDGNQQSTK